MICMDNVIKDKVLTVMREGRDRQESTDFFRAALGLFYLAGLMTPEALDFKKIDKDFNRFIYQTLGAGHTITSVLQFLSGRKVVPVIESPRFSAAFALHCPEVPSDTVPFLLSLNLGVAKNISGLDIGGPLLDWIDNQKAAAERGDPGPD